MAFWKKTTTFKHLDLSESGFDKLRAKDPTFPKPIKMGEHGQSAVFFDSEEIAAWMEAQKAKRTECAVEVAQ